MWFSIRIAKQCHRSRMVNVRFKRLFYISSTSFLSACSFPFHVSLDLILALSLPPPPLLSLSIATFTIFSRICRRHHIARVYCIHLSNSYRIHIVFIQYLQSHTNYANEIFRVINLLVAYLLLLLLLSVFTIATLFYVIVQYIRITRNKMRRRSEREAIGSLSEIEDPWLAIEALSMSFICSIHPFQPWNNFKCDSEKRCFNRNLIILI